MNNVHFLVPVRFADATRVEVQVQAPGRVAFAPCFESYFEATGTGKLFSFR